LDDRKLQFEGSVRPAARYLYVHYCLQVLRRAWKAGLERRPQFLSMTSLANKYGLFLADIGGQMSDSYNHVFGQSVNAFNSELISGGSPGGEGALVGKHYWNRWFDPDLSKHTRLVGG
jgi:Amidase